MSSISVMDANIRILLILRDNFRDGSDASRLMHQAYDLCKEYKCNVKWVKESEVDSSLLCKTDVLVFEEFSGSLFNSVMDKKCVVVGPLVISVCLIESKPIPAYTWPMYNVAMYSCIVTATALPDSKKSKAAIKEKVELMGGWYIDGLSKETTHLIVGSVRTEKYLAAAEAGVSLMRPSWIDDIWTQSQNKNIHCCEASFLEKHKARTFEGLTVTSTCIPTTEERKQVEKMVTENGGQFSAKLVVSNTNVLVCGPNCTESEKYKVACKKSHIICVYVDWVKDSIKKGYALPYQNYQVQKISTPTKYDQENPQLSTMLPVNMSQRSSIDKTLLNDTSVQKTAKRKSTTNYVELIDKLDVKKAKQAGQYLDGCSIYISGFTVEATEKLTKILNFSGATRNEKCSDSVTHVIVGDPTFHEVNVIRSKNYSCHLVTLQWLLDSIDQQKPVAEERYLLANVHTMNVSSIAPGSPLSKKGISLLRSTKTLIEKDAEVPTNVSSYENDAIVKQYLDVHTSSQQDVLDNLLKDVDNSNLMKQADPVQPRLFEEPTHLLKDTISVEKIFENLKFLVQGFEQEEYDTLKGKIEHLGGTIVTKKFKGVPDYVVVPISSSQIVIAGGEVVNNLYIHECEQEELLTDIAYYHRPLQFHQSKPYCGCVITISSYSRFERLFLQNVIELLGGIFQEQFARVTAPAKGVLASTHLVCSTPTGKKYKAALKWGLPVVSKDWVLECANTGKKEPEGKFLLVDLMACERKEEESVSERTMLQGRLNVENVMPETAGCQERMINRSGILKTDKVIEKIPLVESTVNPGTNDKECTPPHVNKISELKEIFVKSDHKFSPITPVKKMKSRYRGESPEIANSQMLASQQCLKPWDLLKTPNTPLGRVFTPDPSPRLRKNCEYWLMQFPDRLDTSSNASTPLSEVKERLWNKILRKDDFEGDQDKKGEKDEEPHTAENQEGNAVAAGPSIKEQLSPENQFLANKFKQLEDMLMASGNGGKRQNKIFHSITPAPAGNIEYQDSQPCTVGWDFKQGGSPSDKHIFSLSNISDEERAVITGIIETLGGTVSELANYDPQCTHLICSRPARNEKPLACMAAGKWILHTKYIYESKKAGKLLDEEFYEFGNPKSATHVQISTTDAERCRIEKVHWWRKEVKRRGYRAFNDMRAIVVAQKREPIVRVIEAGGGVVVDVAPPFDSHVHATHCLIDIKHVTDLSAYIPLAEQGVYLLPVVYVSEYLYNPSKETKDCIIPYFTKYYSRTYVERMMTE